MAAAVVTVLVDDLLRSLSEEGSITMLGPQWGVEAQLQEIHDLLSSVQGVLPEAERKFPYSFELQDRIRELKDAIYDAEDLLEDLSLEEPFRLRDGKLRRLFRHIESCWFGWRMRRELRAIAEHLRGLTDPLISIIRRIPAEVQEALEAREIPFLGRVNEKGELIRLLLDGGSEVHSIVVVDGFQRHGKTALVQEVMKDLRASGYFDVKIWVNVSPPFCTNRVAQEIIGSLREEEDDEEGEVFGWEQSIHLLARLLDDTKRYLFVLDNVTFRDSVSDGRWLRFKSLLKGGVASGSKILMMVSDIWESIPNLGSPIRSVYIESMDREDAVVLLRETTSQGREGYHNLFNNPAILKIAGDIVDECKGRPRMIKAVGGYLSLQPPAVEDLTRLLHWQRSYNRQDLGFSFLLRGGYPYGDITSPGVKKRYDNLPPRIKQCFALCYLFPSGHPINPHTLAQLWISLGFIHNDREDEDDRRPLEDIAYHYLDVLLQEELFQVKKYDIFGKVKSVTLHPDAQELVLSISGWECLTFPIDLPMDYCARKYARHRSIIYYHFNAWYDNFPDHKLRTFLHFEEDRNKLEEIYRSLIPKQNPKRIRGRVLDLHDVKADVLPAGVWKLKHLRYLDLSGNSTLQMLPPAIIRLLNLQTLKLSGCSSLTELPCEMNNLSALRHLYIDGCWKLSLISRGLCDLKCLNILTDFILPPDDSSRKADSAGLTDLSKLNDLRGSLEIRNLTIYRALKMEHLPEWLSHVATLRFLSLRSCPSLVVLPEWMGHLQSLELIHCPGLASLPEGIHDFTSSYLKKLTVIGCPVLESQLRGNEAEEDGSYDSCQSEEEEEQVEQVRRRRGRASHML